MWCVDTHEQLDSLLFHLLLDEVEGDCVLKPHLLIMEGRVGSVVH